MNQNHAVKGKIDRLDTSWVAGWAMCEASSSDPLELEIFYGDKLLGEVTANEKRQDLNRAGIGNCAFTFRLPMLEDFKPDDIVVVVKGTDTPLQRSWAPNLANTKEVRGELAELSEVVKLTRKVLLAASSRNERALIGMADTVEKIAPGQLNANLNTLSYQLVQLDTATREIKSSADETNEKLLAVLRTVRSNAFHARVNTLLLAVILTLLLASLTGALPLPQ